MQITEDQIQAALDIAELYEGNDFEEGNVDVRRDYSGRYMYGSECVGIVGASGAGIKFLLGLSQVEGFDIYDVLQLADNTSTDSMGLSTITYWTNLEYFGA